MKTLLRILILTIPVISCSKIQDQELGTRSQLSVSPTFCSSPEDLDIAASLLRQTFENYGGPRLFVVKTALRTSVDCLGAVGAELELKRMAREYKINVGKKDKKSSRLPAQATDKERIEYSNYKMYSDGLQTVSTVIDGSGVVAGVAVGGLILLSAPVSVPSLVIATGAGTAVYGGFEIGVKAIDQMDNALEKVATYQSGSLFSGKYDSEELRAKIESAKTDDERRELTVQEIQKKATSFTSLDRLQDKEKDKALERIVQNGIRYSADVAAELEKTKTTVKDHDAAIKNLNQLNIALRDDFLKRTDELGKAQDALAQELANTKRTQEEQFRFLLDINEDKMSARQKITAIEQFNYGDFKTEEDRQKRLDQLQLQAKVETLQSDLKKTSEYIEGARLILGKLGFDNKQLNKLAGSAQKVITGVNAISNFAAGNYMGAFMGASSLFGGGGGSGAAQHAEIMAALNKIMELQRQTIQLQVQTMEMIEALGKHLDQRLNAVDQKLEFMLRLQSQTWLSSYYERVVIPIAQCRDFKKEWRRNMLIGDISARDFRSSELNKSISESGESMLEFIASKNERLLPMSIAKWQENPIDLDKFKACYTEIQKLKTSLFEPFRKSSAVTGVRISVDPGLTLEGMEIAKGGTDAVKNSLARTVSGVLPLKNFLSALYAQDKDLYDQVLLASQAPVNGVRDLIRKLQYITGNKSQKLLADFRAEQGARLELYQSFALRDSSIFINPFLLSGLLRTWEDMDNISQIMTNGEFKPSFKMNGIIDRSDYEAAIRLVTMTIMQQAMLSGDGLLMAIDKYWKVPTAMPSDTAVTDLINDSRERSLGDLAYDVLRLNPTIHYNYMRYKLGMHWAERPYVGFTIQKKMADETKSSYWFNQHLKDSELEIVSQAQDPAQPQAGPAWNLRLKPAAHRYAEKSPDAALQAQIEAAYVKNIDDLVIVLPDTEAFFSDQLILSSAFGDLSEVLESLSRELNYSRLILSGSKGQSAVDKLVWDAMNAEVTSADH